MRDIAIIGAGQAGLLAGHDLLRRGFNVTLFSDKTPEDFLTKTRPTGTACRFDTALSYERELGLEMWGDEAPPVQGVHLHYIADKRSSNPTLTLVGRMTKPGMAVDLRLQSATWLDLFETHGGKVEFGFVTLPQIDEIAAEHDLVIVASGRGEIQKLFSRNDARSLWTSPARKLGMICVKGLDMQMPYGPPMTPVKFNFFAKYGEMFWVPWYSKDSDQAWSLVFEAKPGGLMDVFDGASSADEALTRGQKLIEQFAPWDAPWVRDAEPCDENSWLVGSFTPEVRNAVATLRSERNVMALGDAAQSLDPIGGQGANNGNKMAKALVNSIVERGEKPFDAAWMRTTDDAFWNRHQLTHKFNNTLLLPLTEAGRLLLTAQYGSTGQAADTTPQQLLANRFCDNFNDPSDLTEAFHDLPLSKQRIAEQFGGARKPVLRGKVAIAAGQLRHYLGSAARHPGTAMRTESK
jgi:2-polyprenyl-6-methoxyphenol hydroxylase-like FAD-dependent oxidoreductase